MDIDINEIVSTVRAVDGGTLVSPPVMRRIVEAVVEAVDQKMKHEKRVGEERKITGGVADEQGSA